MKTPKALNLNVNLKLLMHENITFYKDNKCYLLGPLKLAELPAVA